MAFSTDCAKSLFIEIKRAKQKNIVIGVVYRPPDRNFNDFNEELDQLVSIVSEENKTVFLLGDWNLNLMKEAAWVSGQSWGIECERPGFKSSTQTTE